MAVAMAMAMVVGSGRGSRRRFRCCGGFLLPLQLL